MGRFGEGKKDAAGKRNLIDCDICWLDKAAFLKQSEVF